MKSYLYSGKIFCLDCGGMYMGKKQHQHLVYICTNYHNKKSDCPRFAIKQDELTELIFKHYQYRHRYEFEQAKYKKKYGEFHPSIYMERVEVSPKNKRYEIFYIDRSESTVNVMGKEEYFRL